MKQFLSLLILLVLALVAHPVAVLADDAKLPQAMDSDALASASGGSANVNSTVLGDTIGNVGYTGGISSVSASNNSGLTTLIENTGNQVSISTATAITINYH